MRFMKNHIYLKIAVMLSVIALLGGGLTALTASPRTPSDSLRVVTSFYPVYITAQNVAGGIDGVEVVNMVDSQAGCLHDYQMSPADRVTLESADVFVMNGAGAEPFLEAVLTQYPSLTVTNLSSGQSLLESGHVHTHEHEEAHGQEESAESPNGHVWVSPLRAIEQTQVLCEALVRADPAHATAYEQNAAAYIEKLQAVWTRLQAAAEPFADTKTILFHDSLAYLAEDLSLSVAAALNVGEDSGVSAAALAQAEDALNGVPQALFLYDSQYDTVQYTYLQSIPDQAIPISVDTGVTGSGEVDGFLSAMTALCEALEVAYGA